MITDKRRNIKLGLEINSKTGDTILTASPNPGRYWYLFDKGDWEALTDDEQGWTDPDILFEAFKLLGVLYGYE